MYFFKKFSVPNLDGVRGRPGQRKPLSAAKERLLCSSHAFSICFYGTEKHPKAPLLSPRCIWRKCKPLQLFGISGVVLDEKLYCVL